MHALQFFTTPGCHLCDHAEAILQAADATFEAIDIADDVELIKRYGVRIPVVRDAKGRELAWPFDHTQFTQWLAHSPL